MRAERSALGACPSVGLPANGARGGRGRASREFGDGRRSSGECGGASPPLPPVPPGSPPPPPLPRLATTPAPRCPPPSARRGPASPYPRGDPRCVFPSPAPPPRTAWGSAVTAAGRAALHGGCHLPQQPRRPARCPRQPGHPPPPIYTHPRGQPHPGAARMSRDNPPHPPAQHWGLSTGGTRSGETEARRRGGGGMRDTGVTPPPRSGEDDGEGDGLLRPAGRAAGRQPG